MTFTEQIRESLVLDILKGTYAPGDKFLSDNGGGGPVQSQPDHRTNRHSASASLFVRDINDTPDEMAAIETFLGDLLRERPGRARRVELSRQHQLGASKYRALGIRYPMDAIEPPTPEAMEAFAQRLRDRGIDVGVFG